MTLPRVMLTLSAIHHVYNSSNIFSSLINLNIYSTSQSFPSDVFISPWILYAVPLLVVFLEAMFDYLSMVFICRICSFDCWLFLDIKGLSVSPSVNNTKPTNIILPKTNVGTFLLFNTRFDVV